MTLRPMRSEREPHSGPVAIRAMPCTVVATAIQNSALASLLAPIDTRYKGMNGYQKSNDMLAIPVATPMVTAFFRSPVVGAAESASGVGTLLTSLKAWGLE